MVRSFFVLFMLFATVSFAQEEKSPRLHIVLDASGSMWGQVDGRSKIEIARDSFSDLMGGIPKEAQLGLTAYGHRRQGDCSDIETLFKVGAHEPKSLAKWVSRLKPKGKTPLYDAVVAAAEDLDFKNRKATIILLSDGRETCNDDPCASLIALKKQAHELTVHIIGFDVSQAEAEQLHCMAQATDGTYVSAQNAGQLSQALGKLVAVELEPVQETLGEATISIPKQVAAGSIFPAEWTGPANDHDRLMVVTKDGGARDLPFHFGYTTQGSPLELKAPDTPGTYEVIYATGLSRTILARAAFESTPPQVSIQVPDAVSAGSQFTVTWQGPGNPGETLRVFAKDAEDDPRQSLHYAYAVAGRETVLRAPTEPGAYEIRYVSAQTRTSLARVSFDVIAAKVVLAIPETIHAGEEIEITWQGSGNSGDRIGWFGPLGESGKLGDYVYSKSGKNPVVLVGPATAGNYEVQYLNHKREPVVTVPLRVLEPNATLSGPERAKVAEEIEVEWFGPGSSGDMVAIFGTVDGREKRLDYQYAKPEKNPAELLVPAVPGNYEVRYFHGRSKTEFATLPLEVTKRDIGWAFSERVKAGESINITLSEPGLKQARILILDTSKNRPKQMAAAYITGKTEVRLIAPKEPGSYVLAYQAGKLIKANLKEATLVVE